MSEVIKQMFKVTKREYSERCRRRWYGIALKNALHNFDEWQKMNEYLVGVMKQFNRNPFQKGMTDQYFNPTGSLSGFLANCQSALQPNRSRLDPFMDFEERYQKIFFRRGLLIYCGLILDKMNERTEEILPMFAEKNYEENI